MKVIWFERLLSFFQRDPIKDGVFESVVKHKDILNKLERYDRGEIQKTQELARYSSVREYLRDIQKSSSDVRAGGRATSAF